MAQTPPDASRPNVQEQETLDGPPRLPLSEQPTLDGPARTDAAPGPARRHFGDYELLDEIARGGMGVVYRARQKSLNRLVAVKMILGGDMATAQEVSRFRTEAEQAAGLDHPNIVPIHEVGELGGQNYFTMKLIEGGTLTEHMPRLAKDPKAAVRLLAAVAHAVHYAHQRGVMHRDLKPGNILLDADGQPHVTDFGLAKRIEGNSALTQTGAIVGTPSYMAPEQAAGKKALTTAVDVYSLGAILFELLTGRPPFQSENPFDTVMQVLEKDPPRPRSLNPRVSRDLETVCLKCLEKDPARRYGSADALARDLERWLAGEPILARPSTAAERLTKWVRRHPTSAAMLGLSLVGAAGLVLAGVVHNARLEAALEKANTERIRAEANRAEAEANFKKAREAVDNMLTRAAEGRLASLARMEAVRLELLQEALKFYQGFLREKPDDPTIRQETARAHRRLADLARNASRQQLAEASYRQAIQLHQGLADQFPSDGGHRNDLAVAKASLAGVLKALFRREEARKLYEEVAAVHSRLAEEFPGEPEYRQRLALDQQGLAQVFEADRKPAEAEASFRRALEVQRKLLADFPDNAAYLDDAAGTLNGLAGLARARGQLAEVRRLLEEAIELQRGAIRKSPRQSAYFTRLRTHYNPLTAIVAEQGDHAELARLAARLVKDSPENPNDAYNAACYLARSVPLLEKDPALPDPVRAKRAESARQRAVAMLQDAARKGYRDADHAGADPDFAALRDRDDFARLLADMGRRPSAEKEESARRDFDLIRSEYQAAEQEFLRALSRISSPEQAREILQSSPNATEYGRRFLNVAEAYPETSAALDALNWVVENLDLPERDPLVARAVGLLTRHHARDGKVGRTCTLLSKSTAAATETFLRAVLDGNPYRQNQGYACLVLARVLKARGDAAQKSNAPAAEKLFQEAEALHGRVQKEFGNVLWGTSKLADMSQAELFELRHLRVGAAAPEIEGVNLDGKPMKLSDYRGKVVVLDFWVDWCGACQVEYPRYRALASRHANQPFVVLGINRDKDLAEAKKVVAEQKLNYPSWYDGEGGPIGRRWNVRVYPTVYILDGAGVIRHKGVRGKALEQAVDALLREAAGKSPAPTP